LFGITATKRVARRYNLDSSPIPCDKCGKLLYPELPFAYDTWRGLRAKPHECGKNYDLVVVVSVDKVKRQHGVDIYNYFQLGGEDHEG
jgi:hypothetical protein